MRKVAVCTRSPGGVRAVRERVLRMRVVLLAGHSHPPSHTLNPPSLKVPSPGTGRMRTVRWVGIVSEGGRGGVRSADVMVRGGFAVRGWQRVPVRERARVCCCRCCRCSAASAASSST